MSCPANSSGEKSASGVIYALPAKLIGLMVEADGTNAATVTVYDSPSAASGTILAKVIVDATLTHENVIIPGGVIANSGLYVAISGTGAKAVVLFAAG